MMIETSANLSDNKSGINSEHAPKIVRVVDMV